MTEVVGVRFKEVGKIYYFAPNSIKLKLGDYVIVETARGVECGQIAMTNRKINDDDIVHPLKKIIRKANEEDILRIEENRKKENDSKDSFYCRSITSIVLSNFNIIRCIGLGCV